MPPANRALSGCAPCLINGWPTSPCWWNTDGEAHNLSAILRSCDAVGVLEAHAVSLWTPAHVQQHRPGSQRWVPLHDHADIGSAISHLKQRGFRLFGTNLSVDARDYRECDFTGPCAFVLGAEKWGLTEEATALMDQAVYIPMRGMVQSLNVSVATATLLFEALRQRQVAGLAPQNNEGIPAGDYDTLLFEWCYPEVAAWCRDQGRPYPPLGDEGEILEELPRTAKLRC